MLPDFPELKNKLNNLISAKMKENQSVLLNPFSQVNKAQIHEGKRSILIREDGTIVEFEMKVMKANININLQEISKLTWNDIMNKFHEATIEMARQQAKLFYEELDKSVTKVGNIVEVKGGEFKIDHFLNMIEKMELEFKEDGNPYLPTVVAGDTAFERISEVLPQLETDPQVKKHFAEIIDKKREEWSARESNRELVG